MYRKGPPKRGRILFTSDAICRWKDHGVSSTQGYPARNLYLDALGGLGGRHRLYYPVLTRRRITMVFAGGLYCKPPGSIDLTMYLVDAKKQRNS